MKINDNIGNQGFYGIQPDKGVETAAATPRAGAGFGPGLTIESASLTALDALDGVDPSVEAALTRDDELGGLMRLVFDRPPPPMPEFC